MGKRQGRGEGERGEGERRKEKGERRVLKNANF